MNKKVTLGVMAGMIAVPAAVVIDADLAAAKPTSATAYDTVANVNPNEMRLQELQQLSEKGTDTDFADYEDKINILNTVPKYIDDNQATLLEAKLDYLQELKGLDRLVKDFERGVVTLNAKNTTLSTSVSDLRQTLNLIEQSVHSLHTTFDEAVKDYLGTSPDTAKLAFVDKSVAHLATYMNPVENYKTLKKLTALQTKLETFESDLVRANAFVYGGSIISPSGGVIQLPGFIKQTGNNESLVNFTTLQPAKASVFRDNVEKMNTYFNENLTKTQQQIVNVFKLADGTIVGNLMKAATDDITAADKVNEAIDKMATKSFKTGEALKKELATHQTSFNKLNDRQKALVVQGIFDANGKVQGYDAVLAVMQKIDALKPAATKAYHDAVQAANDAYQALTSSADTALVQKGNYSKLTDALQAVADSLPVIDAIEQMKATKDPDDIEAARNAYDALSAAAKKVVYNYQELQAWEKVQKSVSSLESTIGKLTISYSKAFGSSVASAYKKYTAVDEEKRTLIPNAYRMEYLKPFGDAVTEYYTLKITAKDYKQRVADLQQLVGTATTTADPANVTVTPTAAMQSLIDEARSKATATGKYPTDATKLQTLLNTLIKDVAAKQQQIDDAEAVDELIEKANGNFANMPDKLTAILAARTAYDELGADNKDSLKLVSNLNMLKALERAVKKPLDVMKKIDEVNIEATTFASKAKGAVTAYNKLTATEKKYLPEKYVDFATDFTTFLAFVDQMKAIKPTQVGFKEATEAARKRINELAKPAFWETQEPLEANAALVAQVANYDKTINSYEKYISDGETLVQRIDELSSYIGQKFLNEIAAIDNIYAQMDANGKKQVTNYKQFQAMKKDGTAAMKVVSLIGQDTIRNLDVSNPDFVKRFDAALKAYDKLTATQKRYVYNYETGLKPYINVYNVVKAVGLLKPSSKTYLDDVANVRALYNALSIGEQNLVSKLLPKITGAETNIAEVEKVIKLINEATPEAENYVQKLIEARQAYDRLSKDYQKLVTNYKLLTDREKQLKPVTTAIYQIIELDEILQRPKFDAADFVKKYTTAIKNYESIDYEARPLVYNRETLFTNIYPLAQTIKSIDVIKPNSATFNRDVKEARSWYDALSAQDQARVPNYNKLLSYEETVSTGDSVDQMIVEIASKPPTLYMQAIKEARAAYDILTAEQKKAVTRYKDLQNHEKAVKNVQAAIDAIDAMQFASNLMSAYDKASKALDKLTADQRQMVSNISKLQSVAPAVEVYKMIQALKPSNPNYTGAVQAAYAAYNTLSTAEKQYVTNFTDLQDAKNNIDNVQKVIALISGISPSSRDYAKQVEEAMALYNSLPSTAKKLVTNFEVLKGSQQEITAVANVKQMISAINPEANDFAAKVKAARAAYDRLSTTQKRLVGNYFLLQDYEAELDDMSFFF